MPWSRFDRTFFQWLCHSDARRVCDLPAASLLFATGLRPAMVIDHQYLRAERQLEDLPRIGVAEPLAREPLDHPLTRMVLTPWRGGFNRSIESLPRATHRRS